MGKQRIDWKQAFEEPAPASNASTPASEINWAEEFNNPVSVGTIEGPSIQSGEESQYDAGYLTSFGDLNSYRAEMQPLSHELANKTMQVIPGIIMGTAEMLGYMVDAPENIAGALKLVDTDFDNWLSKGLRELREDWGEEFPVYSRNPEKVMDFGDSAWWVNNLGDTVESIMEFLAAGAITGGALGAAGKGMQTLGAGMRLSARGTKLAGITNNLAKAVYGSGTGVQSAVANSLITAQGIGALNAYQVYDDIKTRLQGKVNPQTGELFTEDELHTLAGESAAGTFRATALASTILNMSTLVPFSKGIQNGLTPDKTIKSTAAWLKKLKEFKADPKSIAKGDAALKWYQKLFKPGGTLAEMGQEGIEEIHENWQQQLGTKRGLEAGGEQMEFDPWSEENILAFALGAFGGGIASLGKVGYEKLAKTSEQDKFAGLLDKHIAAIEDFQRFSTEIGQLQSLIANPKLPTEKKEKVARDFEQKLLEWQATAAEAALNSGTMHLIEKELTEQLQEQKQVGELLGDDTNTLDNMLSTMKNQFKVNAQIRKANLPDQIQKLTGWTGFMIEGTKTQMQEHQKTVDTIYNAAEVPQDIRLNSQIAALEHIVKYTSDSFVKEEAQKKIKELKDLKGQIEGAEDTTNDAAIIVEARKFNSTLLNQKYKKMNTALMSEKDRAEVIKEYNKERRSSKQVAEAITKKQELLGQIEEYLARDTEDMTVSELEAMEKSLAESESISSPFVEETLRDLKKTEYTSRGIGLTLDQLKGEEKASKEKEEKPQADENAGIKEQIKQKKEAKKAENDRSNLKEDQQEVAEDEDKWEFPEQPVKTNINLEDTLETLQEGEDSSSTSEEKRIEELEALPFSEDDRKILDAVKKKGDKEAYKKKLKHLAQKLGPAGNKIIFRHNAEDALANPKSTIAERVAAKRNLEQGVPYNGAAVSDINKIIHEIKAGGILYGGSIEIAQQLYEESNGEIAYYRLDAVYNQQKSKLPTDERTTPDVEPEDKLLNKPEETEDKLVKRDSEGVLPKSQGSIVVESNKVATQKKVSNTGQIQTVLKGTVQLDSGLVDRDGNRIFYDLVDAVNGNTVVQRYIPGLKEGNAETVFNTLYTENPKEALDPTQKYYMETYRQGDEVTIKGKKYHQVALKNGKYVVAEKKTYYLRKKVPSWPVNAVFKTDPDTGDLLINSPALQVGTEVVVLAEPDWSFWQSSDPATIALNVYLKEDIENGRPKKGVQPLTQIPSTERGTLEVGDGVREIRKLFAKDFNLQFETTIGGKTSGNLRKMKTGQNWQQNNVLELKDGYVKTTDGLIYRTTNDIPIIILGDKDKAYIPEAIWERLSEAQKATLKHKRVFEESLLAGVTYSKLVNPAGDLTTVTLSSSFISEEQFDHLFTTFEDGTNLFSVAKKSQGSALGTNFLPGLTEYYQVQHKFDNIPEAVRNFKPGRINFTGASIIIPVKETSGETIYYSIQTTPRKGKTISNWNEMVAGRPFNVEKYRADGTVIPLTKEGKPVMFLNRTTKAYEPVTYHPIKGEHIATVRTRTAVQFKQVRRNVSTKLLEDGKTEYLDRFTDTKYKSYLDYVLASGVLTTSHPANAPFEGVGIWLGAQQSDWSTENTTENPEAEKKVAELIEKEKAAEKTIPPPNIKEDPKPKATQSTIDTSKLSDIAKRLLDQSAKNINEKPRLVKVKNFEAMGKAELDWFKEVLGDQYLQVAKGVDRVLLHGREAFGYYHNAMVTIAESAAAGTAYHEAFHLVFDLSLSLRERANIYNAARKKYTGGDLMSESELEEAMADDFMYYRFNRENYKANSLITKFFKALKNYINTLLGKRTSLDTLFENISDGNFELDSQFKDTTARPRLIMKNYSLQQTAIRSIKKRLMDHLSKTAGERSMGIPALANDPDEMDIAMVEVYNSIIDDATAIQEEFQNLSEEAYLQDVPGYTKKSDRLVFLSEVLSHWGDTTTEGFNPRDGLASMVKRSLAANGFKVRVKVIELTETEEGLKAEVKDKVVGPPEDTTTKAAENQDDPDPETLDNIDDDIPEEKNPDKVYGNLYLMDNPKNTLAADIKFILGNLTSWEVENGSIKLDEDGNPVPKLNEYGEQELIGDFDDVYALLRDKLANVPMNQIIAKLDELSYIHDEFAIIKDAVYKRRNGAEFFAKFMTHFYADKKKFLTIIHDSDQSFRIMETNRADLAQTIAREWKIQGTYLSTSEDVDQAGEIIPEQAAKARTAIEQGRTLRSLFNEGYLPSLEDISSPKFDIEKYKKQAEKVKPKNLTPEEILSRQYHVATELIKAAKPAMDVLGIVIDNKIWQDMYDKKPSEFYQGVSNVLFALGARNPASLEQMVKTLEAGEDPYEKESKSVAKLVKVVEPYEVDNFTASFINGEKKTVYGINLHNYLSKNMQEIISNPQKFVATKSEDVFYAPGEDTMNYFLETILKESTLEELGVFNFDTFKGRGERSVGTPYDRTNNQESIISRMLAYNNNEGGFGYINTGTKSDKGQSLYIKLPKIATQAQIDRILKNTIAQEKARILRLQKYGHLIPDNENYKTNGTKFLYIPQANNIVGILENFNDVTNSNVDIAQESQRIEAEIEKAIQDFKNQLITENLYMLAEEGVITLGIDETTGLDIIESTIIPEDFFKGASYEERITEFILNDFLWNMEMGKVFMGDLAFYSSKSDDARTVDYFKRAYQTITPGQELFISTEAGVKATTKESLRVLTMKDPIIVNSDEYMNILTKGLSADEKFEMTRTDQTSYKKFNTATDAMSYCTIEAWRELQLGFGTWTNTHTEFYINAWSKGISPLEAIENHTEWITPSGKVKKLNSKQKLKRKRKLSKAYLEAIKPFYYGDRNIPIDSEEAGSITWFEQVKTSIIPLFPEFTNARGGAFQKLLADMQANNVDMVTFNSAIKVGQYNSVEHNSDGNTWTSDLLGNIKELPLRNYRVPQKITTKDIEGNAGTQMNKIIAGNLLMDSSVYNIPGKDKPVTGREWLSEYHSTWADKIALTERGLKKELGLSSNEDGDWSIPTEDPIQFRNFLLKLRNLLDSQNLDRQLHENYQKNMEIVKTDLNTYKYAVPIDFPAFSRKYESILMSLFRNKVLRQKFPGGALVQMADYETDPDKRLKFVRRDANGSMSAEIAVPQWFVRKWLGIELPVGKIDPETAEKYKKQLEIIGFRIPTQSKGSMLAAHIAEILPEAQGSVVMVPPEITVQMGSDFDVDKLFLMTQTTDDENNVIKYDYEENLAVSKAQVNNKIIDLQRAILTNENHAGEVLAPLSSKLLEDIVKRFKKARLFDHINSLHTNIYQEYINKFAKQAVGITATYITGQTMYKEAGVSANLQLFEALSDYPSEQAHELGVERTPQEDLVSDLMKVWNNAALDNAKDPILGYLNINNLTINAALLMSAAGYTLDTTVNFINQPIVKELSRLQAINPNKTISKLVQDILKVDGDLKREYDSLKVEGAADLKINPVDLTQDLNKTFLEGFDTDLQAKVLILFEEAVEAGMDLSKINKVLSPETAKNLSTFSALEEFTNIVNYLVGNETRISIDPTIFNAKTDLSLTEKIAQSPLPRVTAFYERGLKAAESFSKELFAYNSNAYKFVKDEIAKLIGPRNYILTKDQIDIVNANLGYLVLTDNNKLADALFKGRDFKTMFFDKENSLAAFLEKLKQKHPEELKRHKFIKNLAASEYNPNMDFQAIYYNNTSDRSIEEKNAITQSWLSLINHSNPEFQLLGKALVAYSVVTSGFQTSPNSFFDLIPTEFWESSGLVQAWEDAKENLLNEEYMSESADVVVRMAFQDLVSSIQEGVTEEGISPDLRNVVTDTVKNESGKAFAKNAKGQPNIYLKEFTVDLRKSSDARVQGIDGNPVAKQYVKVYHPVKKLTKNKNTRTVRSMSGFRLYRLVGQDMFNATYKEIQPLGEKNRFKEGKINDPTRKSKYPKWAGIFLPKVFAQLEPMQTNPGDKVALNSEVEDKIRSFLNKLGVKVEALETLKEKFGVDAKGASDIVNSIIYLLNTEEGLNALPEEAAHFFVEGLADHDLLQRLIDQVDGTPEYAEVLATYSDIYNQDALKLRKEAAAKIIAKHLFNSEPVGKNWLRRLLDKIKSLINSIFKGKDPYREAANYILQNNTEILGEADLDSGVLFALDLDAENFEQSIKNMDPDRIFNKDFEAERAEKENRTNFEEISEESLKNLKASFQSKSEEVAKVINKIKKGLITKFRKLERLGQEVPDALANLHDSLNKLEGIKFLEDLGKAAMVALDNIDEQEKAFDFELSSVEKTLNFIHRMEVQLGTFNHIGDLTAILEDKYEDDNDEDLLPIIEALLSVENRLKRKHLKLNKLQRKAFISWMRSMSTREISDEEADRIIKEVSTDTGNTGLIDEWLMSLVDSHDPILSAIGKKIKTMEIEADEKFGDFLRGTEDSPGLAQVTKELLDYKKTDKLEELYDDFIVWDPSPKTGGKYKFVVDPKEVFGVLPGKNTKTFMTEKWEKLQALPKEHPVRRFYDHAIEPYLEERRSLVKKGMGSVIGDFNNVPVRKKRSSETSLGTVEWAKIKVKNLKDELRVVEDDQFLGAVDETGRPIRFVPYRYNYSGSMSKEDFSMEIANGLAFAMQNIFQANEKRAALPIIEAAEKILLSRDYILRDEKTGREKPEDKLSGPGSASYKKFKAITDAVIYGEEDQDFIIENKNLNKVMRTVKSSLSFLNLGFNVASQIVNPIVQAYEILNEALGGRDYSFTDIRKGFAKANKNIVAMLRDYHSKTPKSKETLLMERLGLFSHGLEDINLGRKDNLVNNFFTKMGLGGFKLGNALVQPGVAYAMMSKKKIKLPSGKEITFEEAWEMKNGSLVFSEEARKAMGGQKAVTLFIAQIQNAVRKISDNRSLSDKGAAETHWWGKFLMMHRSWMVPMFVNLWENIHFNETTGRWEQGSIRTAVQALGKVFSKENILQLKNLVFQFDNLTTADINPATGKPFTEDQLALYKANIKKAVSMMYTLTLLTASGMAWDDEDKKDSYLYYLLLRSKAEIFSMLNPRDILRVVKSPSAAVNNIDNLLDVLQQTVNLEKIERGPYEGWTKAGRAWSKFVPVYNQYMNLQKTADKIKFMEQ